MRRGRRRDSRTGRPASTPAKSSDPRLPRRSPHPASARDAGTRIELRPHAVLAAEPGTETLDEASMDGAGGSARAGNEAASRAGGRQSPAPRPTAGQRQSCSCQSRGWHSGHRRASTARSPAGATRARSSGSAERGLALSFCCWKSSSGRRSSRFSSRGR